MMEKRQKEQDRNELNLNETEKVNGGVYVPHKPDDPDDDENSDNSGGGATGGW